MPSNVEVGAIWRSKRKGESHRTIEITFVEDDRVFVRRNTSRRKQAISIKTLERDYRFERRAVTEPPRCSVCGALAVCRVALSAGCYAFEDAREQELCLQHLDSIEPIGTMDLLEDYTVAGLLSIENKRRT